MSQPELYRQYDRTEAIALFGAGEPAPPPRPRPDLSRQYDRTEAIALFGAGEPARLLCRDLWAIFPEAVLCFADVDAESARSDFATGARFRWVADRRYEVAEGPLP